MRIGKNEKKILQAIGNKFPEQTTWRDLMKIDIKPVLRSQAIKRLLDKKLIFRFFELQLDVKGRTFEIEMLSGTKYRVRAVGEGVGDRIVVDNVCVFKLTEKGWSVVTNKRQVQETKITDEEDVMVPHDSEWGD